MLTADGGDGEWVAGSISFIAESWNLLSSFVVIEFNKYIYLTKFWMTEPGNVQYNITIINWRDDFSWIFFNHNCSVNICVYTPWTIYTIVDFEMENSINFNFVYNLWM